MPAEDNPTYKTYNSSPGVRRMFCSNCGSALFFLDGSDETEIWIGSIDEEFLVGKKVPGSEKQTEKGVEVERAGGFGPILAKATKHNWMENAILGITDEMDGVKHLRTSREGNYQ